MTWNELIEILMDSPLYFTMSVRERFIYINWFADAYAVKFC